MPEVGIELYKVIEARGPDAVEFLQNQLTQDLSRLGGDAALFSAWCNPKGRVIVTMRLVGIDDGVMLVLPENMSQAVIDLLLTYRFRAKVDLSETALDPAGIVDPAKLDPVELIQSGIPTVDAGNSGMFTPHMLNLDKLDAISFSKGCYTGQEIVARTEHRGRSKRRTMIYTSASAAVSVGAQVEDDGRSVGNVVNVAGTHLLAVTPVELHDRSLRVEGVAIEPQGLPYAL